MKVKMAILPIVLLLGVVVVRARLGETVAQIYARYGAVQSRSGDGTNDWIGTYSFKHYTISVWFRNSKSARESVMPKGNGTMSFVEVQALRNKIGGKGPWKIDSSYSDIFPDTTWTNTITGAQATAGEAGQWLDVISAAEIKRMGTNYMHEQKARTKGF